MVTTQRQTGGSPLWIQESPPIEVFRAMVRDLSAHLSSVRREVNDAVDPEETRADEARMLGALANPVWRPLRLRLCELAEVCRELDEVEREVARRHATAVLQPHFLGCGFHRRAIMKPQGYAGDYKLVTYYFAPAADWVGVTRFDRLMHGVAQQYTLSQSVPGREKLFREAIHRTIAEAAAPRIASIASGPALEMERAIRESDERDKPITFFLFDQDADANAYAEERLRAAIAETGKTNIEVVVLTESIRALLKPKTPAQERLRSEVLAKLDYVYSSGLYDYLDARAATMLTAVLAGLLAPGGRLSIGNLQRRDDTSWLLDYVLDWRLIYRTVDDMRAIAAGTGRDDLEATVTTDESGGCLVLHMAPLGPETSR